MNLNEYISSGIVESYVLGLADDADRAEFESMCAMHEEVRAARNAFELALEEQAMLGATAPPVQIRNKLFSELNLASAQGLKAVNNDIPAMPAKVVTSNNWVRYLAAASVLLLVGSTVLNFYLFTQYKDYSERYSSLLASQTELANNNRVLQTSLNNYQSMMDVLKDTSMSVIRMIGSNVPKNGSPDPSSVATIYWNKRSSALYLLVNALPQPATNQQYQLWAIVKGKPVSAGVFDMNRTDSILKMANMPAAEAFAITLEKAGGSQSPEGAMYVLGSI